MSHLHKSNWFAVGLLITGGILAVISIVGFIFNSYVFASFSWMLIGFLVSIAFYVMYNVKKIADEMLKEEDKKVNS